MMRATNIDLPRFSRARFGLMILIVGASCAVLWHQLKAVDIALVSAEFAQISLWQWIGALWATGISYFALGQYDRIWHATLRTGVRPRDAQRTGMCAMAIGQAVGMTAITASFVRWRRLPGLNARQIVSVSAGVSASFMICWVLLALPALWWVSQTTQFGTPSVWIVLLLGGAIAIAGTRLCNRHAVPKRTSLVLFAWICVDVVFAALVIAVLLPTPAPLGIVIAAVIIATGAGLISNAPGGIGAFDLTLIALLPMVPFATLVSVLLAYRLVYILLPFTLAAIALIRDKADPVAMPVHAPAAWGLSRQTGQIVRGPRWIAHVADTAVGRVAIGDPIGDTTHWTPAISAVYKCSARTASTLRKRGWRVGRCALEARLNPQAFTTSGAKRQSLRRKLRKAEIDRITIRAGHPRSDEALAVAKQWAQTHGGELGFSMGRFDSDYLAEQRVFLIIQDNALRGFISFHVNGDAWALDLIRYVPGLSCGAIQLALVAALDAAKADDATRMCLGAVPSFTGQMARFDETRSGLVQFKRSFGPTWHPVYHAARNPVWFWLTGFAVLWAIQRPLHNLRYQARVINVMRRFQLNAPRARGIAGPDDKGTLRHDAPASQTS